MNIFKDFFGKLNNLIQPINLMIGCLSLVPKR